MVTPHRRTDQKKYLVHRKMGFTIPSYFSFAVFFLLRFFLLQEGYRFLAPFGFILFISIKYRKVMVGLLTPGYRIMRYDDGSCVSRSKVLFLWFFLSLVLSSLPTATPLSSSFGPSFLYFIN